MPRYRSGTFAKDRGYTLIDMAMSLVIVGLVVSGLTMAYKIYFKDRQVTTTKDNVQVVARAIENFILENGRFPCPAAMDIATTNNKFGVEADCDNLHGYNQSGGDGPSVSAGGFDGGIWVQAGVGNSSMVVRGMVPFTALNLPEFYTVDGYGNRIFYAVTASQTNASSFMREGGAISVIDSAPGANAANARTQTNHFLVYSAGANRLGAYSRYGKAVLACGSGLDSDNCGISPTAVYRSARHSTVGANDANADQAFDDIIANNNTMMLPLWRLLEENNDDSNMRTIDAARMVTIGDASSIPSAMAADVKFNVQGVARSSQRSLAADYCVKDQNGLCFQPRLIAGNSIEMDCNSAFVRSQPGSIMRGIGQNQARCRNVMEGFNCVDNKNYISGFDAQGRPLCVPYVYTIPTVSEPPAYCHEDTDYQSINCPSGEVGRIDQKRELSCPGGTWGPWTDTANTCISDCVPTYQTQRIACPSGQTGDVYQRRDYTCPAKTWGSWYNTSSNCQSSCAASYETQTIACPSGQTGNRNQRRDLNCGTTPPSWGAWNDVTTDCCLPTSETASPGCPSGYVGVRETRRDYSCPAATWSAWYDTTNTCVAVVSGTCGSAHGGTYSSAPGSGLCGTGTASSIRGSGPWEWDCVGANGGGTATCYADKTSAGGCFRDFEMFVKQGCPSGSVETVSVQCSNPAAGAPTGIVGSYSSPAACTTSPSSAQINGHCTSTCIGSCGSANGVLTATAPSSGLCNSASNMSPPVTDGGSTWNWTCSGANSSASCSAPKPAACTPTSETQTVACPSGEYGAGITQQRDYACPAATWGSWYETGRDCSPPPPGACCGSSAGQTSPWAPSSGFCSDVNGVERGISGGGVNADASGWSWSCMYADCPAFCSSYRSPSCGSANGVTTASQPSGSSLCGTGGSTGAVDGGSTWNWTCVNGSEAVNCSAPKPPACTPTSETRTTTPCPSGHTGTITEQRDYSCPAGTWGGWYQTANTCTPNPGQCGAANGGSYASAPSSGLCNSGSPSSVTLSGSTWNWTCSGSPTANCSASKPASCTWQAMGTSAYGDPNMEAQAGVMCGGEEYDVFPGSGCTGCVPYMFYSCTPGASCTPGVQSPCMNFVKSCNRTGGGPMIDHRVDVYQNYSCECE